VLCGASRQSQIERIDREIDAVVERLYAVREGEIAG
jgi:hypothetical protein